ncbi:hypothetical protein BKI52_42345 [marine bacterium AO1-C]|nr:hypothetical protein BKI52_42345 [marine bacterium AO1-C]
MMKLLMILPLFFVMQIAWTQTPLQADNHYFEYYLGGGMGNLDTINCLQSVDSTKFIKYDNGSIKEIQRFKYCLFQRDTLTQIDSLTKQPIKVIQNYFIYYTTGIWKQYSQQGELQSLKYCHKGNTILITADTSVSKTDTLTITKDSVSLKMADYKDQYRYVIKRSKNNQKLLLHFVTLLSHSAWEIYDRKPTFNGFLDRCTQIKPIERFFKMDYPGKHHRNYADFGKRPNGVYYVCYSPLGFTSFIQEIVLVDD